MYIRQLKEKPMAKHISRKERQAVNGIGPANAHFSKGQVFAGYYTKMSNLDCGCGCGKLLKNCPNKKEIK